MAYPNTSRQVTRLSVGAKFEALALAAIANTLIKFPGVEEVQILVEGRSVQSLAGHLDVSKPVGRDEAVLLLKEGGGRAAPGAGERSRSDCIDAARVTDIRWLNGRPVGLIPLIWACSGKGPKRSWRKKSIRGRLERISGVRRRGSEGMGDFPFAGPEPPWRRTGRKAIGLFRGVEVGLAT